MHTKFKIALFGLGLLIASTSMAAMVDRSSTLTAPRSMAGENPEILVAHWFGDWWEPRWRHEPRWDRDPPRYWHPEYSGYWRDDRPPPHHHPHNWSYDRAPFNGGGKPRPRSW